jgi:hypothetical protein
VNASRQNYFRVFRRNFLTFDVIMQYDCSETAIIGDLSQQKLQTRKRWRNNADAIYIICLLTCGSWDRWKTNFLDFMTSMYQQPAGNLTSRWSNHKTHLWRNIICPPAIICRILACENFFIRRITRVSRVVVRESCAR